MIKLRSYAKLNLSLDIKGIRDDGYHEIDTIMQSISLYDTVTIKKADYMRVYFNNSSINAKKSTAYRALQHFVSKTGIKGADIYIQKCIPLMSGLGGASANAAAVLIGLDKLFGTRLTAPELSKIAVRIGADVPFCLMGGTARATGIGEMLEPLFPAAFMHYCIVKPRSGVATASAFCKYDTHAPVNTKLVVQAVLKGDVNEYLRYADNALTAAALAISPEIIDARKALVNAGAKRALMSGSGSTVFAAFEKPEEAQNTADSINGDFELCGVFSPQNFGIEVIGGG